VAAIGVDRDQVGGERAEGEVCTVTAQPRSPGTDGLAPVGGEVVPGRGSGPAITEKTSDALLVSRSTRVVAVEANAMYRPSSLKVGVSLSRLAGAPEVARLSVEVDYSLGTV